MNTDTLHFNVFSGLRMWLVCLIGIAVAGCQTARIGTNADSPALALVQTFEVAPLEGINRFIPLPPETLEHATRQAIIQEMELKGYHQSGDAEAADVMIQARWVVTQVENPQWRYSGGNIDQLTNMPSTVPAATLRIALAKDGQSIWRGDSGWPVILETFSIARLEQSVHLALGGLPLSTGSQ